MTYDCLKILHILSAALLLACMGYSYHLWRYMQSRKDGAIRSQRIQTLTWLAIMPLAVIQLTTGFSMLSINHDDMSQLWVSGSVIGFVTVVGAWFAFLYFLLLSQQIAIKTPTVDRNGNLYYRRIQSMLLSLCALGLLVMVFLMANKVT